MSGRKYYPYLQVASYISKSGDKLLYYVVGAVNALKSRRLDINKGFIYHLLYQWRNCPRRHNYILRQITKTPKPKFRGAFLINTYARETLIYKGLLGVKIHYIIEHRIR